MLLSNPMDKYTHPLFLFFVCVLAVWLWRAWRAVEALRSMPLVRPEELEKNKFAGRVSVIIPAKNEEANIRACLESFLRQDYPDIQITVVNDNSNDRTETILREMGIPNLDAGGHGNPSGISGIKIGYINSSPTPPGWTGKNFAIHCAIPKATGAWFLFTDADTRHEPASVSSAVAYAVREKLELLTLTPRCLTGSFAEDLVQPCAMAFVGLWFPFRKVNDPASHTYFANGQYLLMTRKLYGETGGHEKVKGEFLEDFALMKIAKLRGAPFRWAHGIRIYGTRMYDSLSAAWRGWRRIFLHAFEKNAPLIASRAASLFVFSILPFTLFPQLTDWAFRWPETYAFAWGFALPTLVFILGVGLKAYGIVGGKRIFALLQPVAALFLFGVLLDAVWMAVTKKKTVWR